MLLYTGQPRCLHFASELRPRLGCWPAPRSKCETSQLSPARGAHESRTSRDVTCRAPPTDTPYPSSSAAPPPDSIQVGEYRSYHHQKSSHPNDASSYRMPSRANNANDDRPQSLHLCNRFIHWKTVVKSWLVAITTGCPLCKRSRRVKKGQDHCYLGSIVHFIQASKEHHARSSGQIASPTPS